MRALRFPKDVCLFRPNCLFLPDFRHARHLTSAAYRLAMCLVLALAFTAAAQDTPKEITITRVAMGAEFQVILYPPQPGMFPEEISHLVDPAFEAIDGLEQRISTWIPESKISRLNRLAAQGPVETSQEIVRLLTTVRDIYRDTGGAFDITVGPLLELWGFYKKEGHLPKEEEVKAALEKVGLDKVEIDETAETVYFTHPDMRLDFGGIGKGLALDYAAQVLKEEGIKSALLNAGTSTLVALGRPPNAPGWTVRIRSPYNESKEYLDEVQISDESLSTSSGTEKFFELEGKRYCHIFDPRTGWPVEGVLSATAIAPTGTLSDALSTAFFVMGREKTEAYCKAHPKIRAIIVVSDNGAAKPIRINF